MCVLYGGFPAYAVDADVPSVLEKMRSGNIANGSALTKQQIATQNGKLKPKVVMNVVSELWM